MALPSLDDLTGSETMDLAVLCLDNLTLNQKVQVILKAIPEGTEREELVMWLQDVDDPGEVEEEE